MESTESNVFKRMLALVVASLLLPKYYGIADIKTLAWLTLIMLIAEISSLLVLCFIPLSLLELKGNTWAEKAIGAVTLLWLAFPYIPALYFAKLVLPGFTINGVVAFVGMCIVMFLLSINMIDD